MAVLTAGSVAAVVLAGGTSRRFGSDKLAAAVDGQTLLARAVSGLPADWTVIVVGPQRSVSRPVTVVREEPSGAGPAAGLVAGASAAVAAGASTVVSLPGDAPNGGLAARELVARLTAPDRPEAVVGVDADGVDQPLHLAVTGTALQRTVSWPDPAGRSARRLLAALEPLCRLPLPGRLIVDVDTPDDLRRI